MESAPAEYKGYRIHDEIEVNVKFPIDPKAKSPHDLVKVMTNNFVYQLKAVKEIVNECAKIEDELIGKVIHVLKPIAPQHSEGNAILTKIHRHLKMKFEVWQNGSKQWYKFDDIKAIDKETQNELLKIEVPNMDDQVWNEIAEQQKLCDRYKEAISEATEEIKGAMAVNFGSSNQMSTSTTMFPNGIKPLSFGIDNATTDSQDALSYMLYAGGLKSGSSAQTLIKKALALLAEQKQNELKEIEELIKKL